MSYHPIQNIRRHTKNISTHSPSGPMFRESNYKDNMVWRQSHLYYGNPWCPACRTYEIATRFWVVVICPIIKCLIVLEFSFILFDLCLFITIFNFILNYVLIVTFWIYTYHKICHRWNPLTKASDAELWCFFYLRLNKRLSKQSWGWWFEKPSH